MPLAASQDCQVSLLSEPRHYQSFVQHTEENHERAIHFPGFCGGNFCSNNHHCDYYMDPSHRGSTLQRDQSLSISLSGDIGDHDIDDWEYAHLSTPQPTQPFQVEDDFDSDTQFLMQMGMMSHKAVPLPPPSQYMEAIWAHSEHNKTPRFIYGVILAESHLHGDRLRSAPNATSTPYVAQMFESNSRLYHPDSQIKIASTSVRRTVIYATEAESRAWKNALDCELPSIAAGSREDNSPEWATGNVDALESEEDRSASDVTVNDLVAPTRKRARALTI